MTEVLYARAVPLLEAEVDDEIIGLDRKQGEVFGFNKVASDVWRLLERPQSAIEICGTLQEKYDVSTEQCLSQVTELLEELVKTQLVERSES